VERYGAITPDVDRRTRPLRADAARNRARVLDAAEAAVTAKGAAVSTEEVARRAGVGIGTVFRHFPTKEALLEAEFAARLARFAAEADDLVAGHDPRTALFLVLGRAVDAYATKHAIADALAAAGVDATPLASLAGRTLFGTLDRLLTAAQDAGTVRADVGVDDLVALLVGVLRAAEHAAGHAAGHAGRHPDGDPGARHRLLTVVLDGLLPPAGDRP
jgi:AcrR family transcriptional regulator